MGIITLNRVWSNSRHSGSHLLALVAIADHINDSTGKWSLSYDTLARKCRCSRRQAIRLVKELVASGELVADINAGIRGANSYRIACFQSSATTHQVVTSMTPGSDIDDTSPGDADVTTQVTPVSPVPTVTSQSQPTENPQQGHFRAAPGVKVLIDVGVSLEACDRLLERLRAAGKHTLTEAEARAFVAEVARCRGWTVADAVEEIGPGLSCRVLHTFRAEFLAPRRAALVGPLEALADAEQPSEQLQAMQRLAGADSATDADDFGAVAMLTLSERARRSRELSRMGIDPVLHEPLFAPDSDAACASATGALLDRIATTSEPAT